MDTFTVLDTVGFAYAAVGVLAVAAVTVGGLMVGARLKLAAANAATAAAEADVEHLTVEVQQVSGANGDLAATITAFRSVLVDHLKVTLRHADPNVRFHAASLLSELDFARLNIGPDVRVAPGGELR